MAERIDQFAKDPFLIGPAQHLVTATAELFAAVKQFKLVFGDAIYDYRRDDFSIRELPGARFYNLAASKSSDNGWLTGDLLCDVIFPASLRRNELQLLQDVVTGAMWQQFRRESFFLALRERIPALNELGRVLSVDKSLGYQWNETIVPLTQFTVNFKLDLRIWDDYLTSQYLTVDEPFERTLENLKDIRTLIDGVLAAQPEPVEVQIEAEAGDLTTP